jgi:hypothetical protein
MKTSTQLKFWILAFGLTCLVAWAGHGATYYIAPGGSDSNSGLSGSPWASIGMGFTNALAGDTVLVAPGNYNDANNAMWTQHGGASNSPIVIRGTNASVSGSIATDLKNSWWVIDGLTFHYGMWIRTTASDCTITNCTFTNFVGGGVTFDQPPTGGNPADSAQRITVINCRFDGLSAGNCFTVFGAGHLFQGNVLANCVAQDAWDAWGSNVVIRANTVTNFIQGDGPHPDILQTFGNNGIWMVNYLFEDNYVVNCPGIQLVQLEQTKVTTNSLWGIVIRNNVFKDSTMQSSIDLPNVRFYNNTFLRCDNGGELLDYNFSDPLGNDPRGTPYGGQVFNNAFINCSGSYSSLAKQEGIGTLTPADAGGGGRTGGGSVRLANQDDTLTVFGTATNLSSTVTGAVIFYYPTRSNVFNFAAAGYDITNGGYNVMNGVFYWTATMTTNPFSTNGWSAGAQSSMWNSFNYGFKLLTTTFGDGEISGPLPAYVPSPPIDILVGYNYATIGAVGTNGLTSGALNLTSTNWPVPLMGSVLIDAGTNLSGLGVTNDYNGNLRPQGNGFDVGAFEYGDLNIGLQIHLDLSTLTTVGVADVTGNGHTALQFNSTNNISATNGIYGTTAGQWTYKFTQSDLSGHTYPASQYLAVTNLTGIRYLTNATVSFWAQISTNGDLAMNVLSAGFDPYNVLGGAGEIANATNCWLIGRDYTAPLRFIVYPAGGAKRQVVSWPDDVVQSGGTPPDLSTMRMHLYTVTVDCISNNAVAYYDGQPCSTNTVDIPWLRVYGTINQPWLAIGTATMDGTPMWGDDLYPNTAYFVGRMADVRLWNRTLSAQDASDLFHGIDLPAVPAGVATPPASRTNGSGDSVSFSVVPYGTMPLSYQWSFNASAIAGETNASYSLVGILAPNAGNYQVAVSNAYGMVTSAVASLTVTNPLPTYNSNGLVAWWKFDENTGTNSLDSSYNNGNLALHGGPTWVAGVSNSALTFGSGTWADSLAMVGQAATNISVAMWVQPNDSVSPQEVLNYGTDVDHAVSIFGGFQSGFYNIFLGNFDSGHYPGGSASATELPMSGVHGPWDHLCYASDGSTIWCYLNGTLVHTVSGSMNTIGVPTQVSIGRPIGTASYYFSGVLDDVRIYNRAITGPEVLALFYGTNGIPPVIAPAITSQPQSQTNVVGANVTFSVTAQSDAGTPVYQWKFNGTLDISQSSSAYVLNGITTNNAGNYQVVVTNIGGAATSAVATLTVTNGIGPAITSQPQDWTGITNSTISLTITATGTAPLAYQWKQNGSGLAGASLSGYSKANAVTGDSGTYTVIVTNTYGSTNSGNAIVTVTNGVTPPPVTNGPSSEIIYVGTLVVGGTNAP